MTDGIYILISISLPLSTKSDQSSKTTCTLIDVNRKYSWRKFLSCLVSALRSTIYVKSSYLTKLVLKALNHHKRLHSTQTCVSLLLRRLFFDTTEKRRTYASKKCFGKERLGDQFQNLCSVVNLIT